MFVDYDLLPKLETGINERSREIITHLYQSKCFDDAPFITAQELIDELSWKNRVFAHEYEGALPLLAQPFMLNLPLLQSKGAIGTFDYQCEGFYDVKLNDLGCYAAAEDVGLPFPILPVNGSMYSQSGASAIPPHNLIDIARCVHAFLTDMDLRDECFLDCITGPDFPSGGTVFFDHALKQFYLTGEGSVTIHPRLQKTEYHGKVAIQISEMPYQMDGRDACRIIKQKEMEYRMVGDLYSEFGEEIQIFVLPKKEVDLSELMIWLDKILRKTCTLKCVVLKEEKIEKISFKALIKEYVNRCLNCVSADELYNRMRDLCGQYAWERRTKIMK